VLGNTTFDRRQNEEAAHREADCGDARGIYGRLLRQKVQCPVGVGREIG
jgi:hypothetical protein